MCEIPHFITYGLGLFAFGLLATNTFKILLTTEVVGWHKTLFLIGLTIQLIALTTFFYSHYTTWIIGSPNCGIYWIASHYFNILFHIVVGVVLKTYLNFRMYNQGRRRDDHG